MDARVLFIERPISWDAGWVLQQELLQQRIADAVPDTVLVLQHTPVITLGRRGRDQHLLMDESVLASAGIDLRTASRGGDATYHGPGQVVMYPVVRLTEADAGARGYLQTLEETAIRTAAAFGVDAWTREGKAGAWTDKGKIAAIGFKFSRWVSHHGIGFNVDPDMTGFDAIVPCGLAGEPVASLAQCLAEQGRSVPETRAVAEVIADRFCSLMGREMQVAHSEAGEWPAGW